MDQQNETNITRIRLHEQRLDRDAWHRPLISIIVTHRNYSAHIENALLSLIEQSYQHWECVVVDDASDPEHLQQLEQIMAEIGSPFITLLTLDKNVGQIPSFFAGVDATSGEFVCLLDPDDRYAETFLEEALRAHLNEAVYCPIVSTNRKRVSAPTFRLVSAHGVMPAHERSF